MANIMSLKSLRNKTSRNGFDLSSKRNFTAKAGELLPILCKEGLPGDKFEIDLKTFTRTQPLNTAAFARMREYYDFYFVPYELLWNKAGTVLTQMYDNPQHALSIAGNGSYALNGEMPYVTCSSIASYLNKVAVDSTDARRLNFFGYNRARCSAKLLEYLGYGNFYTYAESKANTFSSKPLFSNLQMNVFGLLGYQKIYADHFRDSQWEKINPSCFNVDYMNGTTSMEIASSSLTSANFYQYYNMFDLRYCNWQKDLFHGVVPRQQYGDSASVVAPLSGIIVSSAMGQTPNATPAANTAFTSTGVTINVNSAAPNATAGTSFSILVLRQAEFLQKWKEITQSGNKDYKEQVEKHWNVSGSDAASELSTYLGGITSSIDINEVVNQNITSDNSADIAGKGVGVSNGRISFDAGARYGLIYCIYHCLPLLDYTSDLINSSFTKINATDYAIPEFDRVGMESVPLVRMLNPLKSSFGSVPSTITVNTLLGYAPRYIDYKTDVDFSFGGFKDTLNSWVISYGNESIINQLNVSSNYQIDTSVPITFVTYKVNPNCLNPIFAVGASDQVSTDQFLCSTYFDIKVVRNLDTDGLPY